MLANAGRVEVFYGGVWGSISSDNWDMNDATVVCRQLGYQVGAEVALKNRVYGPFFGPVWLTNLHCTGNEKNVMECAHDVIGNKSEEMPTTRFASVICKDGKLLGGRFYQCININNLPTSLPHNLLSDQPTYSLTYPGVVDQRFCLIFSQHQFHL